MSASAAIQEILTRLEAILERLALPGGLSGDEVAGLSQAWDVDMTRLESHASRFPAGVTPGDGTRERMQRFVARIHEVQTQLSLHKSEIADQLFSENRRMQSLRRGYGVLTNGAGLLSHKA